MSRRKKASYRIGTSGWHYTHWRGPFYSAGMNSRDMLAFYARHFDTVEINNSFYRLPEESTLKNWAATVPAGFTFAVKASRYITHIKKLKDPQEPLKTFFGRIEVLGEKLGPVLFQLPPGWKVNAERLEQFLDALPEGFTCAFEFRNPTWFDDAILSLLDSHDAVFCVYEFAGVVSPKRTAGQAGYLRLHGPGDKYEGSYTARRLEQWAGLLRSWHEGGKPVYCYFDNDQNGYAPRNALALKEVIDAN
ncbi:MAG: DUF72 domain-containing protein [Chitinivibrionales bacterium]|nr:DUF72 domain-containing protein [Chitinivibrionales bacterium]MBD3397437.1 DUF72 domain-containing protein [Chitinivibrionales bacterium]